MKLYEIILKPLTGFATSLKGDTLFGCFCWQAAMDREILPGGLDRWVACYGERPAVIFSTAWPCFSGTKPEKITDMVLFLFPQKRGVL